MARRNQNPRKASMRKLMRDFLKEHDISVKDGEDINSPRQSFICPSLELPEYSHLRVSTYALIGHEISASRDLTLSMFSPETISKTPDLAERINQYAVIGGIR